MSNRQSSANPGVRTPALFLAAAAMACFIAACNEAPPTAPLPETPALAEIRPRAERGEAEAEKLLGDIYSKGLGADQSYKEAAPWYRRAADQGHAGAQFAMGELCEAGQGVPQELSEAARWFHLAAEQNHVAAQYNLAVLYATGRGVTQDMAQALTWYRRAAGQGDALAQFNLGMRYFEGKGVAADPVEAYQWLTLAAAQKIPDAEMALKRLKPSMTRQQIAEGEQRARQFQATKNSTFPECAHPGHRSTPQAWETERRSATTPPEWRGWFRCRNS